MRPFTLPRTPVGPVSSVGLALAAALLAAGVAPAETSFYSIADASLVGSGGGTNGLIGDEAGEAQPGFNSTGTTRLSQLFDDQSMLLLELSGPAVVHLPDVDPGGLSGTVEDFTVGAEGIEAGAFLFDLPGGTHEIAFAGDGTLSFAYTQATCTVGTGSRESCPITFEVDLVGRGYVVASGVDPATVPGLSSDGIGDLVSYVATLRGFAPAGATVGLLIVEQALDASNARGPGFVPALDGGSLRDVLPFFVAPDGITGEGLLCDGDDTLVDACTVGDEIVVGPGDMDFFGRSVFFGEAAYGRVAVVGDASLGARALVLGDSLGVPGQLDVRGVGASVELAQLIVGQSGRGRLDITDGATVDVEDLTPRCNEGPGTDPCGGFTDGFLATGAGSEGLVRISGAGSSLRIANSLPVDSLKMASGIVFGTIGQSGGASYAEVVVESGGLLETEGATLGVPLAGVMTETAEAWVVVRDADSRWDTGGRLVIAGPNTVCGVEVLDGGEVVVGDPATALQRIILATDGSAEATLRVAGTGSLLRFAGPDPMIETRLGASSVVVEDGGVIEAGFFVAAGQVGGFHEIDVRGLGSQLDVVGICGSCSTFADQPALLGIGMGGSGLAFVTEAAVVHIDSQGPPPGEARGGLFVGGAILAAGIATGEGALTVSGAGSRLEIAGQAMEIQIGASGEGLVLVDEGGVLTVENPMGQSAAFVAPVEASFAGVGVIGTDSLFEAGALLQIGGAAGQTGGDGTVEVAPGATIRATEVTVGGGGTLAGGGLVDGDVDVFAGTLAPGAAVVGGSAIEVLTVSGDLSVGGGGRVAVDVASLASHDLVSVGGAATLTGTVQVDFADTYSPMEGDQFELIEASTPVDFASATVEWSGLPGTTPLSVDADAQGRLRVTVAEPSGAPAALTALGVLALCASRRRRPTDARSDGS